jgi:transglutaminase-like putative cysteine protease
MVYDAVRVNPEYLAPSHCVDSDHPSVVAFAREHTVGSVDAVDQAIKLYLAVRDGFRYDPWGVAWTRDAFRASVILSRKEPSAHCVDKATVLAACARSVGIAARLHFANVRNHIGTAKLEAMLGTDVLVFHGYTELLLNDTWVAATPAFNKELCHKLGVAPLEFNGREDSIFQEFDRAGGRFMEYLHDYGTFSDIPFELMVEEWRRHYPKFANDGWPKRPSA